MCEVSISSPSVCGMVAMDNMIADSSELLAELRGVGFWAKSFEPQICTLPHVTLLSWCHHTALKGHTPKIQWEIQMRRAKVYHGLSGNPDLKLAHISRHDLTRTRNHKKSRTWIQKLKAKYIPYIHTYIHTYMHTYIHTCIHRNPTNTSHNTCNRYKTIQYIPWHTAPYHTIQYKHEKSICKYKH